MSSIVIRANHLSSSRAGSVDILHMEAGLPAMPFKRSLAKMNAQSGCSSDSDVETSEPPLKKTVTEGAEGAQKVVETNKWSRR